MLMLTLPRGGRRLGADLLRTFPRTGAAAPGVLACSSKSTVNRRCTDDFSAPARLRLFIFPRNEWGNVADLTGGWMKG
jgi:hypothetical protein